MCCVTLHFVSAAFPIGFVALRLFVLSFVRSIMIVTSIPFRFGFAGYFNVLLYLDNTVPELPLTKSYGHRSNYAMPCCNMVGHTCNFWEHSSFRCYFGSLPLRGVFNITFICTNFHLSDLRWL